MFRLSPSLRRLSQNPVVFVFAGVSVGWRNSANLSDLRQSDGKLAVSLMSSMVLLLWTGSFENLII
jgi:hypothetical protein